MHPRLKAAALPALAAAAASGFGLAVGAPWWAAPGLAALGAAAAGWSAADPPLPAAARAPAARAAEGGPDPEAIANALPVGLLVVGGDRMVRLANRNAAETFGLPAVPLPVGNLRAPRLLERIDLALAEGEGGTVDFALARGGELHLRAHVRPFGGGDVLVAVEDRTDARRAGELHRDFVANASHELKTPLAVVSAAVETLTGHARDDPAATERFLGLIAAQVGRMKRLVEDLLSLNRIEQNERVAPREPQDLALIVAEAVEALRPAAEQAGARLDLATPEGPVRVLGDRNELGQVFRNLVENAIRYGGPGVEVAVALVPPQPDAPGSVGVTVSDTGPGIAREHLPRLTERFYRVSVGKSREKGGTGLGLAIVKHVVARHRGRLQIESRPGEGSRFTVWLPLADAATARTVTAGTPPPLT